MPPDWLHLYRKLRFLEWILLGYLLLVMILLWVAPHPPSCRGWLSWIHLAVIAWMLVLAEYESQHPVLKLLRDWFPLLMVGPLYSEATYLNTMFFQQMLDPLLTRIDETLFGSPLVIRLAPITPIWFREIIHAVYFSYYLVYVLPPLIWYRRNRTAFRQYLTGIVFVEVFHLVLILLIPAEGPVALRAGRVDEGILFIPLMELIYRMGEYGGAAFPSSHVAVSVFAVGVLFPFLKMRDRLLLAVWVLGICFATIFCGYHYVVDVFGGLVSGVFCLASFRLLSRKMSFS